MTYIISGISRGIGNALAEILLEKGNDVIGIGRSHDIQHPHFSFYKCDFSKREELEKLDMNIPNGNITLVNNAGIIGRIKHISDQQIPDIQEVLMINSVAPVLLTNHVYNRVSDKDNFTLVNISSGAANQAIPSWGAYCASKAALNMISETFYFEEKEKGIKLKVYALAPGVIDTDMQKQIRGAGKENFSSIQKFIDMKENDQLFTPLETAEKLVQLLSTEYSGEVFYDLRTV